MRVIVFLSLIAYASALFNYFDTSEDVERLMKDKERVRSGMACVLDQGPCTEKEEENKKHILGSMMSLCADCEEKEKHKLEVVLKIMHKEYPKELEEFVKKYDLDGKHFAMVEAVLAKY